MSLCKKLLLTNLQPGLIPRQSAAISEMPTRISTLVPYLSFDNQQRLPYGRYPIAIVIVIVIGRSGAYFAIFGLVYLLPSPRFPSRYPANHPTHTAYPADDLLCDSMRAVFVIAPSQEFPGDVPTRGRYRGGYIARSS